jgi:dolichol-phosphate mannosyltransferase
LPETIEFSVVVPVHDEAGNAANLAREIAAVLDGRSYEMVFVDDASRDDTRAELAALKAELPALRIVGHRKNAGQSRGVRTGVLAARAAIIGTLDGDGQNDPADIPKLLAARQQDSELRLINGNRTTRRDTWLRRLSSRVANGVRGWMLGDRTPDTGCGLKVFHRDTFLDLPRFDHMHRFLPALFQRAGAKIVSVPVSHRPRERGVSKYGLHNRLWVGIVDLFGVMWLIRRKTPRGGVREE